MKNKVSKVFFFLIFLFLLGSCIQQEGIGFTVALTPNQINSQLQKYFPLEQELKIGKIILKDPQIISIGKEDKINLGLSFAYKVPLLPTVKGKIAIAGGVKYNPEKKALFLKSPELKDFEVFNRRVPSLLSAEGERLFKDVISYIFDRVPIYKFDEKSIYGKFVKDIQVKEGKILITFGI